jgi:uncharacterized protein (DUF1697 family)
MLRYIAFLRGVNVGGHKIISKETFIEVFTSLGFSGVRTYIQSGNVLFESPDKQREELTERIQQALLQATGHNVTVMLRTIDELEALVASDPFGDRKQEPRANVYVAFLATEPGEAGIAKLLARQTEEDTVEIRGENTLHLVFRDKGDGIPHSPDFVEKDLKVAATVRNWNTVTKIAKL